MTDRDEYDDIPEGYIVTESLDAGAVVLAPDGTQTPIAIFRDQEAAREETGKHQVSLATTTSWMDSDPDSLETSLQRRRINRTALMEWLWGALVSGIDYGQIKPTQKPSLWQPGAEKICGYLDLTPSFPDAERYVNMVVEGVVIGDIVVRCYLTDAQGRLVGEGMGARERDQTAKLNDRIKMAQKSALIDAVKRCAGLSEVFTQDESDESAGAAIDKDARNYLQQKAQTLFGDNADQVLMSLALRRFNITDSNWHEIPAIRLQDAIRSLEEKAAEDWTDQDTAS
jgi:hypothetical protein